MRSGYRGDNARCRVWGGYLIFWRGGTSVPPRRIFYLHMQAAIDVAKNKIGHMIDKV